MSSVSAPYGFRASYHPSGQVRPKQYTIATGFNQSIFSGDPVRLNASGVLVLATSDGTRTGTTDGIAALGIFAGVQYNDATGRPTNSPFWPASTTATEIEAWVYDDPETLYDVQYTNPSPGTTVQTAVGKQADWLPNQSPAGSTMTGLSNTQISALQGTEGQFQITGFAHNLNDSLTDTYVNVTVRLNDAQYKAPVNTVS